MALSSFPLRQSALTALVSFFDCLDESWCRRRVWGPMQVFAAVFIVVSPGAAMSYQRACGMLFDWAGVRFGWKQAPHASGMSRGRDALTLSDCRRVFDAAQQWARSQMKAVCGPLGQRPVVAFDGTTLHVPRSASLVRAFGLVKDSIGCELSHYPQARLVCAWDVVRRMPVAWTLSSPKRGERELMVELLPQVPADAVIVLDRGYPSRDVLGELLATKRDVVMRMVSGENGCWKEVEQFLEGQHRDAIVDVTVGHASQRRVERLRLVRRVFAPGRPHRHQTRDRMVIMTSLTDPAITADDICALYGERWGIETFYRELKSLADIERWHGTTKARIEQELIAAMTWFTITAVIAAQAEAERNQGDTGPERWRVNTRRVFDAIAYIMEALFMASATDGKLRELCLARANEGLRRATAWQQRRRPKRSHPRTAKHPYARKRR
jgi:hypothetical protein